MNSKEILAIYRQIERTTNIKQREILAEPIFQEFKYIRLMLVYQKERNIWINKRTRKPAREWIQEFMNKYEGINETTIPLKQRTP